MIEKQKFIKFLNYIGIRNEDHQDLIYVFYENGIKNHYRVSRLVDYVEKYRYGADTIVDYVIRPDFRKNMDEEVEKYGNREWSKELKKKAK